MIKHTTKQKGTRFANRKELDFPLTAATDPGFVWSEAYRVLRPLFKNNSTS